MLQSLLPLLQLMAMTMQRSSVGMRSLGRRAMRAQLLWLCCADSASTCSAIRTRQAAQSSAQRNAAALLLRFAASAWRCLRERRSVAEQTVNRHCQLQRFTCDAASFAGCFSRSLADCTLIVDFNRGRTPDAGAACCVSSTSSENLARSVPLTWNE